VALDREAVLLEEAREVLGARLLVAGRVDGIEADERKREIDGVHASPIPQHGASHKRTSQGGRAFG
jgi:hypothetical protein